MEPVTGDRRPETGDGRATAWQCPSCARLVPRHVEVCRCGSERKRLEALGYKIESAPSEQVSKTPQRPASRPPAGSYGPAATLVGYQIDTDLNAGLRVAIKTFLAIAAIAVGTALVHFTHTDPDPVRDNIEILSTLEGFTRSAGPDSGNTIPMFLGSGGRLGILSAAGTPTDPVRSMEESDLKQGFCSQSIVRRVRHEYPGFYENWPDDKLERMVLEKHPDYSDRVCVLSVRFDAAAGEIIKYDLQPRSVLRLAGLWSRTLLITLAFAAVCLNVYYRLIIGRLFVR